VFNQRTFGQVFSMIVDDFIDDHDYRFQRLKEMRSTDATINAFNDDVSSSFREFCEQKLSKSSKKHRFMIRVIGTIIKSSLTSNDTTIHAFNDDVT
jgi:hypothetical protein